MRCVKRTADRRNTRASCGTAATTPSRGTRGRCATWRGSTTSSPRTRRGCGSRRPDALLLLCSRRPWLSEGGARRRGRAQHERRADSCGRLLWRHIPRRDHAHIHAIWHMTGGQRARPRLGCLRQFFHLSVQIQRNSSLIERRNAYCLFFLCLWLCGRG